MHNRTWVAWTQLVSVVWLLLCAPEAPSAKETILWVNDELPPAFISDGPDRGEGIIDGVVKIYQRHLPEYEHRHLGANMTRILDLMRKGEKVCYAGFFKTPQREKFIYFSIPNIINYNNAIVASKDRLKALFGDRREISLKRLLSNKQWTMGITKDRSYGLTIDQIIKQHGVSKDNILIRAGTDSLKGLLSMAHEKRIDYTIGFPWEVPYVASRLGLRNAFGVIHISETGERRWGYNYIGVPRTAWGHRLIQKINAILVKVRPTEAHMTYQLKWFPANMEQDIRRAYKEKILSVLP